MWGRGYVLKEEIKSLQASVTALLDEKKSLKEQLEEIKLKKRLEQEEIKHLQKINEELLAQELENERVKLLKKYQEDITVFKEEQRVQLVESLKEFHVKMEDRFNGELNNLKEVYGMLMSKLPNVNMEIVKNIGPAIAHKRR